VRWIAVSLLSEVDDLNTATGDLIGEVKCLGFMYIIKVQLIITKCKHE